MEMSGSSVCWITAVGYHIWGTCLSCLACWQWHYIVLIHYTIRRNMLWYYGTYACKDTGTKFNLLLLIRVICSKYWYVVPSHYGDVIMSAMASHITSIEIVYSNVYSNIKAPSHWPLCGDSPGTGEFPAQKASDAENVSIWWRHHEYHWWQSCIHLELCVLGFLNQR